MALPIESEIKGDPSATQYTTEEGLTDRPLNYSQDQLPDIDPQLRKLDMEWLSDTARENIGIISSAVLIGGALGFLWRRKYLLASNCLLAFLVQQVFFKEHRPARDRLNREDLEIERYALRAPRGDYGKLEVIPFR